MNVHEKQENRTRPERQHVFIVEIGRFIAKENKTNSWNQKLKKPGMLVASSSES